MVFVDSFAIPTIPNIVNVFVSCILSIPSASCDELPGIANGVISYSPDSDAPFGLGTLATYTCNDGYELVRNMMRTCVNTSNGGIFDGLEPSCQCE